METVVTINHCQAEGGPETHDDENGLIHTSLLGGMGYLQQDAIVQIRVGSWLCHKHYDMVSADIAVLHPDGFAR